jgi:hypothetical protein
MIGSGIADRRSFNDDNGTMTSPSASMVQDRGDVAFALCEAAALTTRTQALLTVLWSKLGAFADDPRPVRRLERSELEQLAALGEEVAELASQVALIIDDLPRDSVVVERWEIAESARTALADGIVDQRRARAAASLLTIEQGFPALAESLTDSDAHTYWTARVVDVLAAFQGVDETRARQAAALAGVPDTARFHELPPERVLELAHTLYQLAAR